MDAMMETIKVLVMIVHLGGQQYGIETWDASHPEAMKDCQELSLEIANINRVQVSCVYEVWPRRAWMAR